MDRADLRLHWAEVLDKLIWETAGEQFSQQERLLCGQLTRDGLRLAEVLPELSDESLALAIQKGILKEAFEELFVRRYEAYLARWFYGWRVAPDQAREIVQEMFLKFLTNRLASFRPTESFRAYLWRVAYNRRVDLIRRGRKACSLDGVAEPPINGAGPEQEAEGQELAERVEAALKRLPPDQEQVLRAAMDGQSADEMAAALTLPKSRIFTLLFRARRQMEQQLGLPARKRPPRSERASAE
jgi:RNA polymerase sigma-70 factor (ECF subfamily)